MLLYSTKASGWEMTINVATRCNFTGIIVFTRLKIISPYTSYLCIRSGAVGFSVGFTRDRTQQRDVKEQFGKVHQKDNHQTQQDNDFYDGEA